MPVDIELSKYGHYYLGISENGVYCASIHDRHQLLVWILNESCGQIEWVLKPHIDLQLLASCVGGHLNNCQQINGALDLTGFYEQ